MNVESGYFLEEPERIERLKQELSSSLAEMSNWKLV